LDREIDRHLKPWQRERRLIHGDGGDVHLRDELAFMVANHGAGWEMKLQPRNAGGADHHLLESWRRDLHRSARIEPCHPHDIRQDGGLPGSKIHVDKEATIRGVLRICASTVDLENLAAGRYSLEQEVPIGVARA
jgi:hypothetical protein